MPATNAKNVADAAATEDDIAEFTVAPGRTVCGDDGDVGPGGTIILPVKEGEKLQKRGFLLDDDGSVAVNADGPATVAGIEITEG